MLVTRFVLDSAGDPLPTVRSVWHAPSAGGTGSGGTGPIAAVRPMHGDLFRFAARLDKECTGPRRRLRAVGRSEVSGTVRDQSLVTRFGRSDGFRRISSTISRSFTSRSTSRTDVQGRRRTAAESTRCSGPRTPAVGGLLSADRPIRDSRHPGNWFVLERVRNATMAATRAFRRVPSRTLWTSEAMTGGRERVRPAIRCYRRRGRRLSPSPTAASAGTVGSLAHRSSRSRRRISGRNEHFSRRVGSAFETRVL